MIFIITVAIIFIIFTLIRNNNKKHDEIRAYESTFRIGKYSDIPAFNPSEFSKKDRDTIIRNHHDH